MFESSCIRNSSSQLSNNFSTSNNDKNNLTKSVWNKSSFFNTEEIIIESNLETEICVSPDLFSHSSGSLPINTLTADETKENIAVVNNNLDNNLETEMCVSPDLFSHSSSCLSINTLTADETKENTAVVNLLVDETNNEWTVLKVKRIQQSNQEKRDNFENCSGSLSTISIENHPILLTNRNNSNLSERQKTLIEQINSFILKILSDLANGRKISITLQSRSSIIFENNILSLRPMDDDMTKTREIKSFYKISIILFIMAEIYKNLKSNTTCTKREIYYNDPEITQSENCVDGAIKEICYLLDAHPWELGIFSQAKGLVAGAIKIFLENNDVVDVSSVTGGTLMPHFSSSITKLESNAKFVLLVEKDTVFEKVLKDGILTKFNGNCILITGKGYPDINTRIILKKIWDELKIPIYGLFDADSYGIEILLVYRHGSIAMSYGNDKLAVPTIKWIGVLPSDIKRMGLPWQAMTREDQLRVSDILARSYATTLTTEIYTELSILQKYKQKCEIEAISSLSTTYLVDKYLNDKLSGTI